MSDFDDGVNLRNEMNRGNLASEVLENEIYKEAFSIIKENLMKAWEQSPARDHEGREQLWKMLKMLNSVEQYLKTVMETGKMAKIQVQEKINIVEMFKRTTGMS